MSTPRLFYWPLVACALCGCTLQAGSPAKSIEPEVIQEIKPVEPIPKDTQEILKKLDGTTLSATGGVRFLNTGVLEFGDEKTPITLTVFTEYHCTYCNDFHQEFSQYLQHDFIREGKIKMRLVPFVINKYPNSEDVIRGLLCAGTMGNGLQMHESLSERQETDRLTAMEYIKEVSLDMETFKECLTSEPISKMLNTQKTIAEELDVTLVPTLFLGSEKRVGLPTYADLRGWISTNTP